MTSGTPLATYLEQKGLSPAQFGALVGAHRTQINRIASGERGASGVLALAIEKATDGAVKAADVVRARKPKRRHARRVSRRVA